MYRTVIEKTLIEGSDNYVILEPGDLIEKHGGTLYLKPRRTKTVMQEEVDFNTLTLRNDKKISTKPIFEKSNKHFMENTTRSESLRENIDLMKRKLVKGF